MKKYIFASILACALLGSCGSKSSQELDTDLITNPNTASGTISDAKVAVMTFDSDMHDFGMLSQGENIAYSFHFTNAGSGDLIISGCKASCGCTVADYPRKRIAPGEDGYISVTFKSAGKSGMQYQEVTVSSNAQPGRHVLKIMAQVR
ncbi:MAG: DUF1573 domain-containing protein [Bacteroidales bacterium]|nr:DUF1573 domain-containing protein [Bacteroidales bacterium]